MMQGTVSVFGDRLTSKDRCQKNEKPFLTREQIQIVIYHEVNTNQALSFWHFDHVSCTYLFIALRAGGFAWHSELLFNKRRLVAYTQQDAPMLPFQCHEYSLCSAVLYAFFVLWFLGYCQTAASRSVPSSEKLVGAFFEQLFQVFGVPLSFTAFSLLLWVGPPVEMIKA